jgi:hypothetical protein
MPRYEELEHDTHEEPGETPPAGPVGLSSPTSAGVPPAPKSVVEKLRRKAKGESEEPWLRIDNDAIWDGDPLDDD